MQVSTVNDRRSPTEAETLLESHLGYWLRLVSNQVSATFTRALQARQVTVAEWVALNQINDHAEIAPAQLADAMSMTRGAITKVLDKLETKAWIVRVPSVSDQRVQCLSLTRQGRRILPELAALADANDLHFFAALSATEQAALRAMLRKIAAVHCISSAPVE